MFRSAVENSDKTSARDSQLYSIRFSVFDRIRTGLSRLTILLRLGAYPLMLLSELQTPP
jgi:hypothetical protein